MIDLARHAAKELRRIGVRLDWKATFDAFVEAHGGMPVRWGGRLLFPDGWGHALDHRGPEFPPPADELQLRHLQWQYQAMKRKALIIERDWLQDIVNTFEEARRTRSAPLQMRFLTSERDEFGNQRWGTGPAEEGIVPLRNRLRYVTLPELEHCEQELQRLEMPQEVV